jgi:phosphate uptake regulator
VALFLLRGTLPSVRCRASSIVWRWLAISGIGLQTIVARSRELRLASFYLFIAKAIERIGDHAKNIAEFTVYVVNGTDVRHVSREQLEREALG